MEGAPRKKRWASVLSFLERLLLADDVADAADDVDGVSSLLVEGIVESELKFSGTKTCREKDCRRCEVAGNGVIKAEASFIRVVDVSRKSSTAEQQRRRRQLILRIIGIAWGVLQNLLVLVRTASSLHRRCHLAE